MTKNFMEFFEESERRPTIINWEEHVKAVKDGYEAYRGLAHGVQKDAIQNGWDARKDKKYGKGWSFTFELIESGHDKYLCMTDVGTHGLTGKVLTGQEMNENLPEEERWARFESLAFTKSAGTGALGSRGRGKFIFVAAAKITKTIIYDTLREDGSYRLGCRIIELTQSPVVHKDGREAKDKLKEITNDVIKPLVHVGTRIIIVNPEDEIIDAIKSGEFLRNIEETWWEIILKYNATIKLIYGEVERKAHIPFDFQLPEDDEDGFKVWVREKEKIPGTVYKIKKLHILSAPKAVSEDINGVAIQRGGMKIMVIKPQYMPQPLSEKIYGYITLSDDLDAVMRGCENPEHYDFSFRKGVPNALRRYILQELDKFAKEKMNWGVDVQHVKYRHQKHAEEKALNAINQIARKIGLMATGSGGKVTKHSIGGSEWKDVRCRIAEMQFPNKDSLRVNYGQQVKGIICQAINSKNTSIKMRVRIFIRDEKSPIKMFLEDDVTIKPGAHKDFGPYVETFTKNKYLTKGRHVLTMKLIYLEGKSKGLPIDEKSKAFYIEEDPPKKGLFFEKCEPAEYPEEMSHMMGEAIDGESGGFIFHYNSKHPAYLYIEDDEELQSCYLFGLMAYEVCRIDLTREQSKIFTENEKKDTDLLMHKTLEKIGEFMESYYAEEED